MKHVPRIVDVRRRKQETQDITSLTVRDRECAGAKPGQFAMVWIPGVDEIPMSILPISGEDVTFVVKNVGEGTSALVNKRVGDKIGIRGPYGTFFKPPERGRLLLVGGGTGIVPLILLAKNLPKTGVRGTFVVGARTKPQLFFVDYLRRVCERLKVVVATDDGSYGLRGLASEIAVDLCETDHYSQVFACGREQMIRTLFDACQRKRTRLQASLERVMKCGVGICGSCCVGKYRACVDGPVLNHKQLCEVADELGLWTRDHSGKIVPL
jgi:dihydroorotate dehydrogenase electron transfer subunit